MLGYKYRSDIKRDILSIESDYFWASDISSLNDPCENLVDSEYFKPELEKAIKISIGNKTNIFTPPNEVYEALDKLLSSVS